MYFPVIKNSIQLLDEMRFYDVALMYLAQIGYKDISIVDGSGDGGRDVICSRKDLRIQLSVRKDWQNKLNDEAMATKSAGNKHFIYVTNRAISPQAEQDFIQQKYKQKGIVEISIHDLRRISTALSLPGVIARTYEMLGMKVPSELSASAKDIAISTILLFSQEARELREEVIEANLRSQLLRTPELSDSELLTRVAQLLPSTNIEHHARSALSRLRAVGRITGPCTANRLSDKELEVMRAAELEFNIAKEADIQMLSAATGLNQKLAADLLNTAIELILKNRDLDGAGPEEELLRKFLAEHKLTNRKALVYEVLSKSKLAQHKQYGSTVDHIFTTNTFDIYRALGKRTNISVVFDSSVAMPVLFGLAFTEAKSRYGVAARALKECCDAHSIRMQIPRCYLNEMAAHGLKALERIEILNALPAEAKTSLRGSGNAYISHYMCIASEMSEPGNDLSIEDFLHFFGIAEHRPLNHVENRIQTVLEQFGFMITKTEPYDSDVLARIRAFKPYEPDILVDHDAAVCTQLKNNVDIGYILATWDKTMIDVVEDLARVYADTPARVIDFLSMANGQAFESDQNCELLTSLLYSDERFAQRLAEKIDKIKSTEQAFRLSQFIDDARKRHGTDWVLTPEDVDVFFQEQTETTNTHKNAL